MIGGDTLILIGVVWVGIAVFMGALAEAEGKGGWAWFGATLLFGVFAAFVYWATNSPEDANESDSGTSFIVSVKYGGVVLGSLVVALFVGAWSMSTFAPIPTEVNFAAESYTGPPTDRIYHVRGLFRNLAFTVILILSLLGYFWARHRDSEQPRDLPVGESFFVGVFSVGIGLIGLAMSYGILITAYDNSQTMAAAVGGGVVGILILVTVWFLGIARLREGTTTQ